MRESDFGAIHRTIASRFDNGEERGEIGIENDRFNEFLLAVSKLSSSAGGVPRQVLTLSASMMLAQSLRSPVKGREGEREIVVAIGPGTQSSQSISNAERSAKESFKLGSEMG